MRYQLVEDLQKKACSKVAAVQACRVLDVSRSGYYAHQKAVRQRMAEPLVCALLVFTSKLLLQPVIRPTAAEG